MPSNSLSPEATLSRADSVAPASTLLELLDAGPRTEAAIEAVDRDPLGYGALAEHVRGAAGWLREAGIRPDVATAIVLPNGPELATAFLSTAVAGISAPLNPAYRREEFTFYLDDLAAKVLLIADGLDSPARDVARERGIRIVELGLPPGAPAGVFSLDGRIPAGALDAAPLTTDIALVLHTSGTTSRPKMVPLTHGNLIASSGAVARTLGLSPDDRCLNVMPLFHIHGLVAAVLGSLTGRGSVVCTPGFLAPSFFGWLASKRPSWYTAVPTMHQAILSRAADPANRAILKDGRLRLARSSSAAMPRRVLEELERTLGVPVVEAYGMTEAAHQMASNPLPPGCRKPGSVGRAAGAEIGIMDVAGTLLPQGRIGEVVIRGPSVTSGYRNNPEANARAYADGWLRTGDEGALDEEGYLTLTGRLKEQINRAGEKISPLEVDQVLIDHPAVAQALCFALAHPILGEDIAAAVVLRPGATATERELREYVSQRLAYYKVPRRVVLVDTIPTGPTGKLQRLGLAERLNITADVPVDDLDTTAPRSPVEEIVAAAWAEVMRRPAPGVRRNFFALGGDSILATQLVARIREQLVVELTLLALFDAPTVEGIAKAVEKLLDDAPAAETASFPRRSNREIAPATSEQLLLWEIDRGAPGTSAYNLPILRRIEGAIDLGILAAALNDLAGQHEAFRTAFEEQRGGLVQRVATEVSLPLEVLDFRDLPRAGAMKALEERVARPFDLSHSPLFRATAARIAEQETLLLLTTHHLVCDGWSVRLIMDGLARAYTDRAEGRTPDRQAPALDFGDYAAWNASPDRVAKQRKHLDYWRERLQGADLSVDLPTDHPRQPQPSFEGHLTRVHTSNETLSALEQRARELDVTLYSLLLAAWRVVLHRLGGQEDLTFGIVLAGRDSVDVEHMIGYFARTALIRTHVTPRTTFADLVREARDGIVDALDHPASLDDIIGVVRTPAEWGFHLLFAFNEEPRSAGAFRGAPSVAESLGTPGAKADLGLSLTKRSNGLEIVLNARAALYEPETIQRLLRRYQAVLDRVAAATGGLVADLSLFLEGERGQILALAKGTELNTRVPRTAGERFVARAGGVPDRIALISGETRWTYRQLAERANNLAADLVARGLGRGDVVAIVSERTPDLIMAMIAVSLTGAAYLPIEPDQPAARIHGMLEDARVTLALVDETGVALADGQAPMLRLDRTVPGASGRVIPARSAGPDDPAYVIFTSGSTGRPKGVMIPHRALVNLLDGMQEVVPLRESDVVLFRTSIGFDPAIWEVWAPLLAGSALVLAPSRLGSDPAVLGDVISASGVTVVQMVPSLLALLQELDGFRKWGSVERILSGGEALRPRLVEKIHQSHPAELVNVYGPTETTVNATYWWCPRKASDATIPIGRPLPNVRCYVLDSRGEPTPIGIPGELYVGGLGVGLGYINRPELTAERFMPDPFSDADGGTMYRTGDRARFRPDGTIEYLGRADDQLKIHGVRIEPGEIESVLNARPEVVESAVGCAPGPHGSRLIAWVVPHAGSVAKPEMLRDDLASRLPRSMVPSAIVLLSRLPRTPGGKIDRRALPAPATELVSYDPPRTHSEQRVAALWSEILGVEQPSRGDDLFTLGGHSLMALRVAHRLRFESGADVTLRTVLEHPTIASLAAELDRLAATRSGELRPVIPTIPRVARVARPSSGSPPVARE